MIGAGIGVVAGLALGITIAVKRRGPASARV
jgi:hypothetical protein